MKDIDEKIERWIDEHSHVNWEEETKARYLPAVREWGSKVAKTFYYEGVNGLDAFTRMHQEMCHRYVEASKRDNPDAGRILEDIKAFERMMLEYMKAEMVGYEFVDRKYLDVL